MVIAWQVPEVVDFKYNMTLGTSQTAKATGPNHFVESVAFPLFLGGERRSRAQWASQGSLPGSMQLAYDASQMQLLCVAEASATLYIAICVVSHAGTVPKGTSSAKTLLIRNFPHCSRMTPYVLVGEAQVFLDCSS